MSSHSKLPVLPKIFILFKSIQEFIEVHSMSLTRKMTNYMYIIYDLPFLITFLFSNNYPLQTTIIQSKTINLKNKYEKTLSSYLLI